MADYSIKLEDLLDHHLIANEDLVKKKQLGGVGYLINGNMCLGIYDDFLVVRTGKELADILIQRPGIERFDKDNENLDEFIMVGSKIYSHSKAMTKFIEEGIDYTSELPPKLPEDDLLED